MSNPHGPFDLTQDAEIAYLTKRLGAYFKDFQIPGYHTPTQGGTNMLNDDGMSHETAERLSWENQKRLEEERRPGECSTPSKKEKDTRSPSEILMRKAIELSSVAAKLAIISEALQSLKLKGESKLILSEMMTLYFIHHNL